MTLLLLSITKARMQGRIESRVRCGAHGQFILDGAGALRLAL